MRRRVDMRCIRLILLHHDDSNFVHDVNLLGRKCLRAQNHEVRRCFASRWVGEFMHILLKVLKPEAAGVNLGVVQWLYQHAVGLVALPGARPHGGRKQHELAVWTLQH
jgi:hypothetical protein